MRCNFRVGSSFNGLVLYRASACRYCCFYIVSRITSHHVGNSWLVHRIGSRVCSRGLKQRVPIHTEFPYRKVVRERLQRGKQARYLIRIHSRRRARKNGAPALRLIKFSRLRSFALGHSVRAPPLRTFCHPLASSHSTSLLRKLTVILWRLSAYISRRP